MLERFLSDSFRRLVKATLKDAEAFLRAKESEDFSRDRQRIRDELLCQVETLPNDARLAEDYLVAAVDGSGHERLLARDDLRFHLLSTATVYLDSNTRNGVPFQPVPRDQLESAIGEQPSLDIHWHSGTRQDTLTKVAESIQSIYSGRSPNELIAQFLEERRSSNSRSSGVSETRRVGHLERPDTMEDLISRPWSLSHSMIHDELRRVSELAAARRAIMSTMKPKYLMLDGSMSVFLDPHDKLPLMPSGFMLRELSSLARKENVILCAVSKRHTIPFAHKIAQLAADRFGKNSKWFCFLPGNEDPGGVLHIYEEHAYIPPYLAVPYLFSFSATNRPSRIDFDRLWWKKNIFVEGDADATRENEMSLFRDLEFMSRDARWYGYPVALALAHETCKVSFSDIQLAREICSDVLHELGLDSRIANEPREDYGL